MSFMGLQSVSETCRCGRELSCIPMCMPLGSGQGHDRAGHTYISSFTAAYAPPIHRNGACPCSEADKSMQAS